MKINFFCILAAFLLFPLQALFADEPGFSFLKLGSGARPTGLGGAYIAVSDDIDAVAYNPGGLANLDKRQIAFTRAELTDDINYNTLAVSMPSGAGNMYFGVNYLGQSSMEGRGANREASGSFDASDIAFNLAYARKVSERSSIGVNVKYIRSIIEEESADGFAVDMGWYYMPVKDFTAGLAVRNLGPDIKYLNEGTSLPLSVRAGVAYRLMSKVLLAADVERRINEKSTVLSIGAEYIAFWNLSARCGYQRDLSSEWNSSDNDGGLMAGLGFKFINFHIDYAISPFGDTGKAHRLSLGAGF